MQPDTRSVALAAFLLRLALGTMFLAHSLILKLFVFTLPGTAQFFTTIGLKAETTRRPLRPAWASALPGAMKCQSMPLSRHQASMALQVNRRKDTLLAKAQHL